MNHSEQELQNLLENFMLSIEPIIVDKESIKNLKKDVNNRFLNKKNKSMEDITPLKPRSKVDSDDLINFPAQKELFQKKQNDIGEVLELETDHKKVSEEPIKQNDIGEVLELETDHKTISKEPVKTNGKKEIKDEPLKEIKLVFNPNAQRIETEKAIQEVVETFCKDITKDLNKHLTTLLTSLFIGKK